MAFQFYYAFTVLREFAAWKEDSPYLSWLEREQGRPILRISARSFCIEGAFSLKYVKARSPRPIRASARISQPWDWENTPAFSFTPAL